MSNPSSAEKHCCEEQRCCTVSRYPDVALPRAQFRSHLVGRSHHERERQKQARGLSYYLGSDASIFRMNPDKARCRSVFFQPGFLHLI